MHKDKCVFAQLVEFLELAAYDDVRATDPLRKPPRFDCRDRGPQRHHIVECNSRDDGKNGGISGDSWQE
jgi:hypothetical protein